MATIKMDGVDAYIEMVSKLGDMYDPIMMRVIKAGQMVVLGAMRAANAMFANFLKGTTPKKNEYGWFAQVQFKGKTSSGESAAKAASVYEYGRGAGTYTDKKGHKRPYHAQPARPWIRAAVKGSEAEVTAAMQSEYDKAVSELLG